MRRLAIPGVRRLPAVMVPVLLLAASLAPGGAARAEEVLTNEDVVLLVKSGLPLDLVQEKIESSENAFDDSTEALVELKEKEVPDEIIRLMHRQARERRQRLRGRIRLEIQRLASDRAEVRASALDFFHRHAATALPALREGLVHERADLRAAAARALGALDDAGSLPTLRTMLVDPERAARQAAAEALHAMDDATALELARKGVVAGHPPLDGYLDLLGLAGDAETLGFVQLRLLESPDAGTRARAAWALGRMGQPRAHENLQHALLRDSVPEVRRAAAEALGRLAVPASTDTLKLACSKDPEVRLAALSALAEFPPARVVPFLIGSLRKDLQPVEARTVLNGLRKLTHQDFGMDAERWDVWWQAHRGEIGAGDGAPEFGSPLPEPKPEPVFTPAP
jgi:HEAT repeat protein